jgi:hypothetical protein
VHAEVAQPAAVLEGKGWQDKLTMLCCSATLLPPINRCSHDCHDLQETIMVHTNCGTSAMGKMSVRAQLDWTEPLGRAFKAELEGLCNSSRARRQWTQSLCFDGDWFCASVLCTFTCGGAFAGKIDWLWLHSLLHAQKHGPVLQVQLRIGPPNGLLPARYELLDRLLAQVNGRRRVLLIPPSQVSHQSSCCANLNEALGGCKGSVFRLHAYIQSPSPLC